MEVDSYILFEATNVICPHKGPIIQVVLNQNALIGGMLSVSPAAHLSNAIAMLYVVIKSCADKLAEKTDELSPKAG